MKNQIKAIKLEKLKAHPDNPNKMSKANLRKLIANIERTGMYEPLIVRPHPKTKNCYQIINGHHRCKALKKLGYKTADAVVWDIDDQQVDILLITLNRLQGSDQLGKKLELLKKLKSKIKPAELSRFLPQSKAQINKLTSLEESLSLIKPAQTSFAEPIVFFLNEKQKSIVENALAISQNSSTTKSKAARRADAIVKIAADFIKFSK
ncbi:MAG: ParB-like nuclease domain-containing protein [Planctomycetes bacterium]|nr:ParB-like nuclease domain-containing protein [Planctomycetota bacterium]